MLTKIFRLHRMKIVSECSSSRTRFERRSNATVTFREVFFSPEVMELKNISNSLELNFIFQIFFQSYFKIFNIPISIYRLDIKQHFVSGSTSESKSFKGARHSQSFSPGLLKEQGGQVFGAASSRNRSSFTQQQFSANVTR